MAKLEEYRRKRKFDRTPEPAGEPEETKKGGRERLPKPKLRLEVRPAADYGNTFVVQKHRATRLHYDFRLAIDGTLKSWAVPKGPSKSHADKRLAVQVEDHPLEYGGFEGKIPEGSYGAGTVMVWDRGTFSAEGDADALKQLAKGEIKFNLNGEKLRGSFVLVKLKRSEKGNEWLLIKHKDAAEDPAWNVDEHDGSVLTGRTIAEIKEELPPKRAPIPIRPSELNSAQKGAMRSRVEPMLATLADHPFSDPHWLFEIKWDGVRALARIENEDLTLLSRTGTDMTKRYPELSSLPNALAAREAILDGEIVALDARGHGSFERLQERMHVRAPSEHLVAQIPVVYFVFDLLYCDGYDLRKSSLIERKQLLNRVMHASDRFRYSDHQLEMGKELFALAEQNGLEGILAKRTDSPYVSDRSPYWVKLKSTKTVDAVVGGWTAARTAALPFGSLLLGLYQGKKLQFIGHVGSGFDEKKLIELSGRLKELAASACPFDPVPETNEKPSWVSPALVARVKFSGWTDEHSLRHPVFVALREDARPLECQFESEIPPAASAPAVVRSPEIVGRVLTTTAQIEAELFKGRSETVTIELDGKRLRLSNLNKIYFPESGHTKRNLLAYYYRMADFILPFLRDRALVLRRYPDGIKGQAFFQKDLREGVPEWFTTVPIDSEKKRGSHPLRDRQRSRFPSLFDRPWLHRPQSVVQSHCGFRSSRLFFLRSRPFRWHGVLRGRHHRQSAAREAGGIAPGALCENIRRDRDPHLHSRGACLYLRAVAYLRRDYRANGDCRAPQSGHQRTHRCEAASGPRVDRRSAKCPRPAAGCRVFRARFPASAGFRSSVTPRIASQLAPRNVEHKDRLCAPKGQG